MHFDSLASPFSKQDDVCSCFVLIYERFSPRNHPKKGTDDMIASGICLTEMKMHDWVKLSVVRSDRFSYRQISR